MDSFANTQMDWFEGSDMDNPHLLELWQKVLHAEKIYRFVSSMHTKFTQDRTSPRSWLNRVEIDSLINLQIKHKANLDNVMAHYVEKKIQLNMDKIEL